MKTLVSARRALAIIDSLTKVIGRARSPTRRGDANCDGQAEAADIDSFLAGLGSGHCLWQAWPFLYGGTHHESAA